MLAESIYDKSGLRLTVEGMLYRMRTGCPWGDLPAVFGPWNAVYKRFRAWSQSGKWWRIAKALINAPDLEWAFIDGTYAGVVGSAPQAISKSRAGLTTKLHLAVDAYGLPIEFRITGGQVHDSVVAPVLIARLVDAQAMSEIRVMTACASENRSKPKAANA